MFLHYEAIGRAIAGSGALGLREEQWPAGLRDRILGRIVGRVLAHEIGHFVLRSPRHASRGLMRPFQSIAELIAGNGEIFGLTPEDLNLLRAAITLAGPCAAGYRGHARSRLELPRALPALPYTTFSFHRPRRNSAALTTAIVE